MYRPNYKFVNVKLETKWSAMGITLLIFIALFPVMRTMLIEVELIICNQYINQYKQFPQVPSSQKYC